MHRIRFVVRGSGQFPYDMLRYDCCFPVESGNALAGDWDAPARDVVLEHRGPDPGWRPTYDRWSSFTWAVVSVGSHLF